MKIRVLYFASLADRAGVREEELELPDDSSIDSAWARAQERHPRLREVKAKPMAACDMAWSSWERSLGGVKELAFLPPVSGG